MAGITVEIRAAHQRAVDAGRGNFQPVGLLDRIVDVEHRRQRPRDILAILDAHRAVGALGHDLHRAAGLRGDAHAHQAEAEVGEHRLGQHADAGGDAGVDDQARLVER